MGKNKTGEVSSGQSAGRTAPKRLVTRQNKLEALRAAYVADSTLCRWSSGVPMFGQGVATDPRIAFVVMAPTRYDVEQANRFMGGRESVVFNDMLATLGMNRSEVYVTALCKWATPEHRITEAPIAIQRALSLMAEELSLVNPRNVVTLGRTISELFIPGINMVQDHGHVVEGHRCNYVPMYHPSSALVNRDIAQALLTNTAQLNHIVGKVES